jgi:hypothetical protein
MVAAPPIIPTAAQRLADEILGERKVLLWIGAGTSFSAGIPTDAPDNLGLAHQLALVHYGSEDEVYRQMGESFRLPELTEKIGKARLRDLIVQQGWFDVPVAAAHRAIAALSAEGFNLEIVTVNFDPLLENALQAIGVTTEVVYSGTNIPHLAEDAKFVVKLHGCPYRDPDPEHLVLSAAELNQPPRWIVHFLNGRLQQRILVYSGFSGNAPYVWTSIREVRDAIEGPLIEAFAVDRDPANIVFEADNELGAFYGHCQVSQERYDSEGADAFFTNVANSVFRGLLLKAAIAAVEQTREGGGADPAFLITIISRLTFPTIQSFVSRLTTLRSNRHARIRDAGLRQVFRWILILVGQRILEASSFQPVLAPAYHPGPHSSCAAPLVFFDGGQEDALVCRERIRTAAAEGSLRQEFQLLAQPRWFAVVLNCVGLIDDESLDAMPRTDDTVAAGYEPISFRDENALLGAAMNGGLSRYFL